MQSLASKLRHRITILTEQTIRTPSGAVKNNGWQPLCSLWASFEPLSVKDTLTANMAGSEVVARCVIRYREGITHAMRVQHRGITYEIDGDPLPDPKSGREYMTLKLKKMVNTWAKQ